MGPIIIFDKSTLQGISIDESAWLENFFLNNITPLFYVETLADLGMKCHKNGRSSKIIISELAAKTPINGSFPNVHHQKLALGEFLGYKVDMSGRPIIAGGQTKITPEGKVGVHFSEPPEVLAMNRWHKKEFLEVEKEFAREWRLTLSNLNFDQVLGIVNNIVPRTMKFSNLTQIKNFVDGVIKQREKEVLLLSFDFLGIPAKAQVEIINRWNKEGKPSISNFAPYAAFVFKIDLFFYISMLRGFESKERPSHKVDVAYLYYLPFCHVFASNDKLHARIAPLFMEHGQTFVLGNKLKSGLKSLDEYFSGLPESIKAKGVMSFMYPPRDFESPISQLWDRYCPPWRKHVHEKEQMKRKPKEKNRKLLEHLKNVEKRSKTYRPPKPISSDEADHVIFRRSVPVKKGKWRMVSKEVEEKIKKDKS